MTLKAPSTSPHYLSAERVFRAIQKTLPKLINRGVLLPQNPSVKSPAPNSPSPVKPLPK